jgi:hypothetical protein
MIISRLPASGLPVLINNVSGQKASPVNLVFYLMGPDIMSYIRKRCVTRISSGE